MTHQRQKSAITKLVFGVAMKPDIKSTTMLMVAYTSQFGKAQGSFILSTGLRALNKIMAQNTKIVNNNICQTFPGSTYSQP